MLWVYLFGYILHLCDVPFHSLNGVFWWAEVLNFSEVQPITFFISLLCPVEEISAHSKSQRCSPWPSSLKAFLFLLLAFVSATRLELLLYVMAVRIQTHVFSYGYLLTQPIYRGEKNSHSPVFCNAPFVINQDARVSRLQSAQRSEVHPRTMPRRRSCSFTLGSGSSMVHFHAVHPAAVHTRSHTRSHQPGLCKPAKPIKSRREKWCSLCFLQQSLSSWLFWAPCISTWILEFICEFWQRRRRKGLLLTLIEIARNS